MSTKGLEKLRKDLMALQHAPSKAPTGFGKIKMVSVWSHHDWAIDLFQKYFTMEGGATKIGDGAVDELRAGEFEGRLMFYLALRTARRNIGAIERGALEWQKSYFREVEKLSAQIDLLVSLRQRQDGLKPPQRVGFTTLKGTYSDSCSTTTDAFAAALEMGNLPGVCIRDARELPSACCDVIITDPPYGFNTQDDIVGLAELYSDALRAMIDALQDDGHLILAVPDWSHIGRHLPFFALKSFLVQQVLIAAERAGKEVIIPANLLPGSATIFRPPYYWESERALRRAILHFRIRRVRPGTAPGARLLEPASARPIDSPLVGQR